MPDPVRKTVVRAGVDGRAVHDIGGLDFGLIDRDEHDPALWEKRVDAMMIVLYAKKGLFTVDAMRRVIEDYGQQTYDQIGYYDKWVRALRNLMVEQDILSKDEINAKIASVKAAQGNTGRQVVDDVVSW
jgi:hypothetical protein